MDACSDLTYKNSRPKLLLFREKTLLWNVKYLTPIAIKSDKGYWIGGIRTLDWIRGIE